MSKLQIFRRRKKISQDELALAVGVQRGIISLIENNQVLPTPNTLARIETAMSLDRLQIFDKEEIRLLKKQRNRHTIPDDYPHFHIHIVLDRSLKELFSKEVLNLAGYQNIHDWFMRRVADYIKRLEYIHQANKKKDSPYHANDLLDALFDNAFIVNNNISKKRKKVKKRDEINGKKA
mgnify:CR=1 FL=1